MQFTNKIAFVTGGSRGIGRACCLELARNGASVIFTYQSNKEAANETLIEIERLGQHAMAIRADAASTQDMEALAEQLESSYGKLDYLVNNAGVIRDSLLLDMQEEDWDEVLRVNLKSLFVTCRALLPLMFGQKGAIVSISSIAATIGSKGHVNYAASKGGVEAFTRALAIELAPKRLRVNAVAPGYIQSQMSTTVLASLSPDTVVPMRRWGTAEEIAKVVSFLLSDDASYITGEVVRVTGGIQ